MQRRKHFVGVLALTAALAAIVPTLAQAKPTPLAGNDRAHNEIPYLSQGVGVNEEDFGGSASTTQPSVEIPYLSQGVGVNKEDFSGSAPVISPDDRAMPRATPVETAAPIVISPDDRAMPRATPVETAAPIVISPDDRAVPRATTPVELAPIVVTKDSGWSFDNSYVTALALMLGLLAGGTLVAIWSNRREKLSPA